MHDFARSRDIPEKPTPLSDKNRGLMRFLYDMLDDGMQEQVCNHMSILFLLYGFFLTPLL